ncbi:galactosylgalactosylxylosylprotein 3-beta-glucuronosyltransferase P [Harpegnathos saltator]|uniref:galactosylgalactosylxylosylprotein 3-beta-glucuronosyltransferase P n=1 Tax=Harpegnathos saltator TaxID=610380 RepID=UPI000DBEE81F|nr:galactosylgalactosylxylosylprotein 3-beta-glucuronosyltransferase P [Harpegnathos saltator]XP_025152859.1 galactosylgalactosylxylosylprotein 3-beta-glucuronosyltransferase P [Harpegnathos saltator]XP_025152860.1 galactosylgalactosylxylosylprotein 3-beta-glucuronosyltransferase P [Harpegnathos saltator]XP_025152861.1 galactosylgalactosylxylosylprotein 3-beta-glucuronosyltransferase P [Harpegnathos saltator]XP_025152862.1 galactosylgalactosylxylosylprotein 3-beta-glucuronosyltransferase P [Har
MKPSMKMGVIALIGICVVFYQYHLSTGVTFDQVTAFNADNSADDAGVLPIGEEGDNYSKTSRLTEDMIRCAVYRVQIANGLSPEISSLLVQELISQLSKNVSVASRNNSKLPQTSPTTTHKAAVAATPSPRQSASSNLVEPLYIITPTYRRPEQIPELTRMAHTLMLVKNVHWLVIEDAAVATKQVTRLLERTGLKFDHLIAPMPEKYKLKKGAKPRGVSNRNRGLQWIRANATRGVFYFADDDNTYDIELFNEIRKTKTVSMFPVGLCTKFGLSSPILKNGKFAGFYDGWIAGRKFPVDMAGFAVSVKFLQQRPNATMPFRAGYEEDGFLKSLAPFEPRDAQLLADNCTKVLAWHTQTKKNEPSAPLDMKLYGTTNLVKLKQQIV